MHVEERRLELGDQLLADVEEAGAAGCAQELAAGRGEDVAPDRLDVDRELPDRLAGVEEERHARRRG